MLDEKPLVTIIVGCYNHSRYIKDALNSILNQNYKKIQLIVFDDASPDKSAEIIEEWIKYSDINCLFIKNKFNVGLHNNLAKSFSHIEGKYFILMSADDLLMPKSIASQVDTIENYPDDYGVVYGDCSMIDSNGETLVQSMFKHYKREYSMMPTGSIFSEVVKGFYFFLQASLVKTSSFFSINYIFKKDVLSEDWDIQLSLTRNFKAIGCKDVFSKYRYLESSVTRTYLKDKAYNFSVSHVKMLSSYYPHPLNSNKDKQIIFENIFKIFNSNVTLREAKFLKKIKLFKTVYNVYNMRHKALFLKMIFLQYYHSLKHSVKNI
jgi:glycosyltransferase involved in cell wall biosynthesis